VRWAGEREPAPGVSPRTWCPADRLVAGAALGRGGTVDAVSESRGTVAQAAHTGRMSEVKTRPGRDVRAELDKAAQEQALVRVSRSIRRSDKLDGFVVGIGQAWVLLALLDHNIYLNGYAALRLSDVSKVERRGGPDSFMGRALAARGEWPPVGVDVDLDSVGELIRTAAEVAPLVTLHIEEDDPTVCFIGRPVRFTGRSVHLREITSQAEWEKRPTKWAFADVTRVEFGGRYEEALTLIGGAPPA
jgi:hypothetical protein